MFTIRITHSSWQLQRSMYHLATRIRGKLARWRQAFGNVFLCVAFEFQPIFSIGSLLVDETYKACGVGYVVSLSLDGWPLLSLSSCSSASACESLSRLQDLGIDSNLVVMPYRTVMFDPHFPSLLASAGPAVTLGNLSSLVSWVLLDLQDDIIGDWNV